MIVSALYVLLVTVSVPGSSTPYSFEAGRFDAATCAAQAQFGNQIAATPKPRYQCVPIGTFHSLDRLH